MRRKLWSPAHSCGHFQAPFNGTTWGYFAALLLGVTTGGGSLTHHRVTSRTLVRKCALFRFQRCKKALGASEEPALNSLDLEALWQLLSSHIKSPCWHEWQDPIYFPQCVVSTFCGDGPGHLVPPVQAWQQVGNETGFEQRERTLLLLRKHLHWKMVLPQPLLQIHVVMALKSPVPNFTAGF